MPGDMPLGPTVMYLKSFWERCGQMKGEDIYYDFCDSEMIEMS